MTPFEQFHAAQLSSFETLLGLSFKALEGAEKLTALNLQTAKRLLSETRETTLESLSNKNPQELLTQPFNPQTLTDATDKAAAYWRHAHEIATATAGEITRVVEVGTNEVKTKWLTALDTAV